MGLVLRFPYPRSRLCVTGTGKISVDGCGKRASARVHRSHSRNLGYVRLFLESTPNFSEFRRPRISVPEFPPAVLSLDGTVGRQWQR